MQPRNTAASKRLTVHNPLPSSFLSYTRFLIYNETVLFSIYAHNIESAFLYPFHFLLSPLSAETIQSPFSRFHVHKLLPRPAFHVNAFPFFYAGGGLQPLYNGNPSLRFWVGYVRITEETVCGFCGTSVSGRGPCGFSR